MQRVSSDKGWTRSKNSGLVIKPNEKRPHTRRLTDGRNFRRTMPVSDKTSTSEAMGGAQNIPPLMNETMRIKMTSTCHEKGCCNAATSSGLCTKHRVLQVQLHAAAKKAAVPTAKAAVVSGYRAWKAAGCIGPRPTTRPNPNATKTCKARHFYGCGGTPGKYDPETRNQVGRKVHSKACSEAWKAKGGSVRRITTPPAF